ncbi:MAG: type III-B CRISPR module RAMP protein Cmr6 [Anaerolineae bacterium]|nr:type III-B CRISPR module RAMP protein Cmr6 [Anaerolineae bacterium]
MPKTPNHRGRKPPVRNAPRASPPATEWLYPIPHDTRRALETFRGAGKQCRNLGLLFDRYIGYLPGWRLDDKRTSPKKDALEQIRNTPVERELLDAYARRWRALIGDAVVLEGTPKWRFLTGLGRKGPLEVGFTFHPLYGFPIIPGSGLKGLARAYAELVAQVPEDDLARVFGAQAQQGKGIFSDAIPAAPPVLELDVMNPHYPDYYQGNDPPANWQSPQPVFFLTLGAASKFWFAVGGEEKDRAAEWLLAALAQMGAGAKTSAGYGYWKVERKKNGANQ